MSKDKAFQAVLTVSTSNHPTLAEAMNELRKNIVTKIKKIKEDEGDVNVVTASHSTSYSPEGHFASALLVVDVSDPFAELVLDEIEAKVEPSAP